MKLTNLLASRQTLQRQVYLANLAYCYRTFADLARRLDQARLQGPVLLSQADAAEERTWPTLVSLDGRQSMIEEHFGDHDVLLMSDAIAFAVDGDFSELRFDLSELTSRFVTPLRRTLLQAGVELDADEASSTDGHPTQDTNHDAMR